MLDVKKIKRDFPILNHYIDGKPLVYLDNAATTQKPKVVIDAISNFYENYNANIHRGIHTLSQKATIAYEETRLNVQKFINAKSYQEIIFTRNTTESINLVAYSWARHNLKAGDEILLSQMEHHANLIPWYELAKEKQITLKYIPLTNDFRLDLSNIDNLLTPQTKLVSLTLMSNVLGTINDLTSIIQKAHALGALVLIDAAQAIAHMPIDVQKLNCDFLAFSFHKILGPTGVGVLWGRQKLLTDMPPFLTGGNMIASVYTDRATFNELPYKFEAGTPDIANVIASNEALNYLNAIGYADIMAHEKFLTAYALDILVKQENIILYGPNNTINRGSVISFNLNQIHPHDLGQVINDSGIAVRAGHHCCQPLMRQFNITGTIRASLYIYNDEADIDILAKTLLSAYKVMGHVVTR